MSTDTRTAVTTSADQSDLRDLARSIFKGPAADALMLQHTTIPFDPELWDTLSESGLTLLSASEDEGGSGAGLDDAAVLIAAAAEVAAPGPIAEADMLAAWLLTSAGLPVGHDPTSAVMCSAQVGPSGDTNIRARGLAEGVPWARDCTAIVILADLGDRHVVFELPLSGADVRPGTNVAYEPRDSIAFDIELPGSSVVTVDAAVVREWSLRGAYIRSVQTCAALQTALSLTIEHASVRTQFGRAIGKFQSVQNLIAAAAGEVAIAQAAVDTATRALVAAGFKSVESELTIAIAKAQSARAARTVARNSHQVHGAIGFTLDHQLRHFTLKSLAWQQEFGGEKYWNNRVGRLVVDKAESGIWDVVVHGLAEGQGGLAEDQRAVAKGQW